MAIKGRVVQQPWNRGKNLRFLRSSFVVGVQEGNYWLFFASLVVAQGARSPAAAAVFLTGPDYGSEISSMKFH